MIRQFALMGAVALGGCDDTVWMPCGALTPDWHGVQCSMQVHCVSCHADAFSAPPTTTILPLDLIVDVERGDGALVVPGDRGASKLWRVVSGELQPDDGWGLMPWGYDEPLPADQIEHIGAWIDAGAELGGVP